MGAGVEYRALRKLHERRKKLRSYAYHYKMGAASRRQHYDARVDYLVVPAGEVFCDVFFLDRRLTSQSILGNTSPVLRYDLVS